MWSIAAISTSGSTPCNNSSSFAMLQQSLQQWVAISSVTGPWYDSAVHYIMSVIQEAYTVIILPVCQQLPSKPRWIQLHIHSEPWFMSLTDLQRRGVRQYLWLQICGFQIRKFWGKSVVPWRLLMNSSMSNNRQVLKVSLSTDNLSWQNRASKS